MAGQGHPRSSIPICNFLSVINNNLGPFLHRFGDTRAHAHSKIVHLCQLPQTHLTP